MKSIRNITLSEKFSLQNKLGQGTFASVHSAISYETKEKVAIKQVYVQSALLEEAMAEVLVLQNLSNDHIISYKDSFYDQEEFYLNMVMQLCFDSLRGQIIDRKTFQNRQLESFLVQMTSAFLELEDKKIMHLDLKPQNILIGNKKGDYFKLCDFGCAQISKVSRMSGYEATAFGTFNYLAPEMHFNFEGHKSRNSADMWSLGVTLYQMIFWKIPFSDKTGLVNRKDIEKFFLKKDQNMIEYKAGSLAPKEIIDVIKMMLKPIPTDRITWKQLREHLIKKLQVEVHQFMNLTELMPNFIKIFELLIKTAKIMSSGIDKGALPFYKANKKQATQTFQQFVHYIFIIGLRFMQRQEYRWEGAAEVHKSAAVKLMKDARELQRIICKRKEIKQFQSCDFNYQQCVTLDHIKSMKAKIQGEKNELQLVYTVFDALVSIISKSEGIFTSLRPFDLCFKVKI